MQNNNTQLIPIKDLSPLVAPSNISIELLTQYLSGARIGANIPSATFDNTLNTLVRDYTHRKSFDFDPYRQPQAINVLSSLVELAKKYSKTLWGNPELADPTTNWNAAISQGLKYVVGGSFFAHADNSVRMAVTKEGNNGERRWVLNRPNRQIVAILYLNDDYEGGELFFPNVKDASGKQLHIKPKTGDFVLFGGDPRYLHGVTEVTKGERFCVTLWFAPLSILPAETLQDAIRFYNSETK
jgi:hypothetical protein